MRNLNNKIPGAPNFRYKEFIKSQTATRFGISNIPNDKQWENIERLAKNVLQPIRHAFGPIRINSGFRSKELNLKIGGSETSNHCKGEAADIEPWDEDQVSLLDILEWVVENLEFRNIILEYPTNGWVHVDFRTGNNLKIIKLKDKNHNYTTVTIDYLKQIYS